MDRFRTVVYLMRQMRVGSGGTDIPGYMREQEKDKLEGNPRKVAKMWVKAYHRKEYKCKTEKGAKWRRKIRKDLVRFEKIAGEKPGKVIFTHKQFGKAIGKMKKDGAPGEDLITARLLHEAGKVFQSMVAGWMKGWIENSELPVQFRTEVVVPLYKRGSRYICKSFRPVSLVQVALKAMQTVMYADVNKKDMIREDGLTGEYNFGSVKGRDRHMAIWLANMACAWEEEHKKEKGRVVMLAWDADNAFPSLFQDGVDWLMWKKGVRGAVWQTLRNMEKKLVGKVRVNGNFVEIPEHEDGASQGAVSPPHRWKYMMGQWFRRCVHRKAGVEIGGWLVPGVGFVDDVTMNAYTIEEVMRLVRDREVYGDKWGVTWKEVKDSYMVRGNKRGMKEMEQKLEKLGLKIKKEVELLGEWMGPDPNRCPKQVKETIEAMKKAAKALEWMVWKGSVVNAQIVEGLFETMVGSVAESHLLHTRITKEEWERIEGVKALVGKKFAQIHKRASRRGIIAELGWTTVKGRVWKAKLGLYARLRRGTGLIQHTFRAGKELVDSKGEKGMELGFLGSVKSIMRELGLMEYWEEEGMPKKKQWKKVVGQAVEEWEKRGWEKWKKSQRLKNNWPIGLASEWGNDRTRNMGRKDRQLLVGLKLMATREDEGGKKERKDECGVCGEMTKKGAYHLVAECGKWKGLRRTAMGVGNDHSTSRQKWLKLVGGGARQMHYLREIERKYEKATGNKLFPWVGNLGTRTEEGATGMTVLIQQVSEWVREGKN